METPETQAALANIARAEQRGVEYAASEKLSGRICYAYAFGALSTLYEYHVSRLESEMDSMRRKIAALKAELEEVHS